MNPKEQGGERNGWRRQEQEKEEKGRREGGERARNESLPFLVIEIWGLFVTVADPSLS